MKIVELKPINDSAKSFYGKARVIISEGVYEGKKYEQYTLCSYQTNICCLRATHYPAGGVLYHLDKYSPVTTKTTMRHIREFWSQYVQPGEHLTLNKWRSIPCC